MSALFFRRTGLGFFFGGLAICLLAGCGEKKPDEEGQAAGKSYAIYAEFAKELNVPMKKGLNRRVFNKVEAQRGEDISLQADGSITLMPGTYRITGFSLVTMQEKRAAPMPADGLNYPGYCLVYEKDAEANDPLQRNIGIGSPSAAREMTPSLFDLVFHVDRVAQICVGHQSGEELPDKVFLSVYTVDGVSSPAHVFARIAITRL